MSSAANDPKNDANGAAEASVDVSVGASVGASKPFSPDNLRPTVADSLIEIESVADKQVFDDSFVLTATGIVNQVRGNPAGFSLLVKEVDKGRAVEQLDLYHHESVGWPVVEKPPLILPRAPASLVGLASVVLGFFLLQFLFYDANLIERGGSSAAILQKHEWWRAITALFLHADSGHMIGNLFLAFGLSWYLVRIIGPGLTWAGFLFSGAAGNALNAYFYRHSPHLAIGLSTAVFGAAGVWAGFNFVESIRGPVAIRWRKMISPVGAGLAFLALWGASPETDYMAHLWGAVSGAVFGIVVAGFHLHRRISALGQIAISLAVLIVIGAAWSHLWPHS